MLFGKFRNSENWGFGVFENRFDIFKEIDNATHMSLITNANSEGKLIVGDADGNPILVDPPEPSQKEKNNQQIIELENFLSETDWYAIRFADTGEEMPADIKKKRQESRKKISELRNNNLE